MSAALLQRHGLGCVGGSTFAGPHLLGLDDRDTMLHSTSDIADGGHLYAQGDEGGRFFGLSR